MTDFKRQLLVKILKENALHYYLGDIEINYLDEEITRSEYLKLIRVEYIQEFIDDIISEGFKKGHIISPITTLSIEAKHIKFSGKENIEDIKFEAAVKAFGANEIL